VKKYSELLWRPQQFLHGERGINTTDNSKLKNLSRVDKDILAAAMTAWESHMLWIGPAATNGQWDLPPDGSLLRLMIKQTSLKKNKVEDFQRRMSMKGLHCPRIVGSNKIYHREKRRRSDQKNADGSLSGTMGDNLDVLPKQHRISIFEKPFIGSGMNNSSDSSVTSEILRGHMSARPHYAVRDSDTLKHRYHC
jgi:hypothetical protein